MFYCISIELNMILVFKKKDVPVFNCRFGGLNTSNSLNLTVSLTKTFYQIANKTHDISKPSQRIANIAVTTRL